jgi:hypothetical protein
MAILTSTFDGTINAIQMVPTVANGEGVRQRTIESPPHH